MKRKIGLLVILLLILCGMLLAGTNKGYHKDVYSEHYVPVEEVQDELSFSIYKEMDWEQILLQKQEYLTKKAASEILEFLGLKDYIQLPEKSENALRFSTSMPFSFPKSAMESVSFLPLDS